MRISTGINESYNVILTVSQVRTAYNDLRIQSVVSNMFYFYVHVISFWWVKLSECFLHAVIEYRECECVHLILVIISSRSFYFVVDVSYLLG